jgi:hypothetical protein
MGGENNWICIFEADLGCMVTENPFFANYSCQNIVSNAYIMQRKTIFIRLFI